MRSGQMSNTFKHFFTNIVSSVSIVSSSPFCLLYTVPLDTVLPYSKDERSTGVLGKHVVNRKSFTKVFSWAPRFCPYLCLCIPLGCSWQTLFSRMPVTTKTVLYEGWMTQDTYGVASQRKNVCYSDWLLKWRSLGDLIMKICDTTKLGERLNASLYSCIHMEHSGHRLPHTNFSLNWLWLKVYCWWKISHIHLFILLIYSYVAPMHLSGEHISHTYSLLWCKFLW